MFPYPGPPQWDRNVENVTVMGNSLWNTYFKPISTVLCQGLQAVNLKPFIDTPGLHKCSPFGVRSWPFRGLPRDVQPNRPTARVVSIPCDSRASQILKRYFHLQPDIVTLAGIASSPVGLIVTLFGASSSSHRQRERST
jgi:hypothetical protein